MNLSRIIRLGLAATLVSVLVACGGGSSSSSCPASNPNCDVALASLNGLGSDGPLANAAVSLYELADFMANDAGAENLLVDENFRSDAQGLANDLALKQGSPGAPYILYFAAVPGETIDTTTGAEPVVSEVYTLIDAAAFASKQSDTRFYASALTKLAVDIASARATLNSTTLEAELDAAEDLVLRTLGFGLDTQDATFSVFGVDAVPPILDETVDGDAVRAQQAADYRVALEAYAQLLTNLVPTTIATIEDLESIIVAELAADKLLGDPDDATPNSADEDAIVTEINGVTPTYIDARLGGTIESVMGSETALVPAAIPTLVNNVQPSDFDGDGVNNGDDDGSYNANVQDDQDGDDIDDSIDNCPIDPNTDQLDTDGDNLGDACDDDIDGDGAANAVDDQPLNDMVITDADGDEIDDVGGTGLNGPDNCLVGSILFGADSPFDTSADNIPDIVLTAQQAFNPDQRNGTAGPDGEFGTADDILDGDNIGNVCDEDADGDGAPGDGFSGPGIALFGIVIGDPDDLDPATSPTDADSDGAPNSTDTCPNTPNGPSLGTDEQGSNNTNTTVNANGLVFGPSCDADDDGFPDDGTQDLVGVTDIADNIGADNCPSDANPAPAQFTQSDYNDMDGLGDVCDSDDDNDGFPDTNDPSPFVAASTYLFDAFYLRQSDDSGNTNDYKLATQSESVVIQTGGSVTAVAPLDHVLDLTAVNPYNISTAYQTVVNSMTYSGAGFGAAATTPIDNDRQQGVASTTTTVSYSEPNLILDSSTLFPWGKSAFVGAGVNGVGRPDTPEIGAPLTNSAEQTLTSLLYVDQTNPPVEADLNGAWGFVDLSITYGTSTTDLVQTTSRIFNWSLSNGVVTAGSNSQYDVAIGNDNGSVTYSAGTVAETGYALPVGTGGINFTGSGLDGLVAFNPDPLGSPASPSADLIVVSNDNQRGYGVKLAEGQALKADLISQGPYDLTGLVVQPDKDSIGGYTLQGATISFSDAGGADIIASVNFGSSTRASSTFAAGDTSLPTVGSGINPQTPPNSQAFTMDADGRIQGIIEFGTDNPSVVEIEGFFVPGKGLLLRYVESPLVVNNSATAATTSFGVFNFPADLSSGTCDDFNDTTIPADPSDVSATGDWVWPKLVDPNTNLPEGLSCSDLSDGSTCTFDPPDACPASFVVGFLRTVQGGAGSTFKVSEAARSDAGNAQDLNTLIGTDELQGDGFGQGIVFGIAQNP